MRIFYLIGTLFFIVIILIVSFQNIGASCNLMTVFFYEVKSNLSPTFLIFGVSLLGMLAGGFLFAFLHSLFADGKTDEDEDEF